MSDCVFSWTLTATSWEICATTTRTLMRMVTKTLWITAPTSPIATRPTMTRMEKEMFVTMTMTMMVSLMIGITAGWFPTRTSWTLMVNVFCHLNGHE